MLCTHVSKISHSICNASASRPTLFGLTAVCRRGHGPRKPRHFYVSVQSNQISATKGRYDATVVALWAAAA